MSTFELSEPTVFPDLNKREGKETNYQRSHIELTSLKYKHFRSALVPGRSNASFDDGRPVYRKMTGELSPSDASISHMIYNL